jgi:hypothetical protein
MPLLLGILLLVSAIFRFPGLDHSPPELFGDEIDMGYQAYTLLKTGRDMYGQVMPVYIHSLSEWLVPLWMYSTVPTIALAGLNEWGVRLPVAVFGSLSAVILSLLVYQTSRNKGLSLMAGLFLATQSWHIHYSRAAFGVVLMLDLGLLGVLLFLRRKYVLSAVFFALCLYAYSTAWLFVPLIVLVLLLLTKRRPSMFSIGVFVLMMLPLTLVFLSGIATRRIGSISVASKKEITDEIILNRNEAGDSISKLFYNRPVRIAGEVADNYLKSFSPEFLFVRGDPIFRHSMQLGELLPITFPLIMIGLFYLISKKQWLWLVWLVFSPLPSSVTDGGGWHATRLFWMTPPLAVAAAAGAMHLYNAKFKFGKTILIIMALIGIYQLSGAGYYYLKLYPQRSWRWWHAGFQDAMTQLSQIEGNYEKVFINNTYEPALIRFLFWTAYSPAVFLQEFELDQHQKDLEPGFDGFKLGEKYYFGDFRNYTYVPDTLYVTSFRDQGPPPAGSTIRGQSNNPYGEPILYVWELNE